MCYSVIIWTSELFHVEHIISVIFFADADRIWCHLVIFNGDTKEQKILSWYITIHFLIALDIYTGCSVSISHLYIIKWTLDFTTYHFSKKISMQINNLKVHAIEFYDYDELSLFSLQSFLSDLSVLWKDGLFYLCSTAYNFKVDVNRNWTTLIIYLTFS